MARIPLSDITVKNLPLPAKGQRAFWDASLAGFGVRVSQGGAKTWVVVDPRSKTRTQETIGRYPVISLQDARGEAKRRLAEQTLGKHRPRAVRWNTAVESYLGEVLRKRKARTHSDYTRLLKHFPFGSTWVGDVSSHDVQKKLDKLADTPSEQEHAFVAVRAFLNWCHRKHYVTETPAGRMKSEHKYVARERVLSDNELKKVWAACPEDAFGRIVKLLILTGQRRGEIAGLVPEMVTSIGLKLPASLTKNGREHSFPIGPAARELLVFPMAYGGFGKAKARLDKASGVSDWTLHDLRRTFASGLASQGVPIHVVEKLLNHISGSFKGIVGVYQKFDFWPEMEAAMTGWEKHVLALVKSGPAVSTAIGTLRTLQP